MDRFEEFTELLARLLATDHVTHRGTYFETEDARTLPLLDPAPPLVVAANGPRGMRIAAAHGSGWMTTGPGDAADADDWWVRMRDLVARADAVLPEGTDRYLNLDSGPQFSLASVDCFVDAVGRAAELGFTDVVTHRPRPDGPHAGDPRILADALAAARAAH